MSHVFIDHMQFGDLEYLKSNAWAALLYMHSQPPLLNLILYFASQLPGEAYDVFIIINSLSVLTITSVVFVVLKKYLSFRISAAIALLYVFSPSVVLYVVYPFYPILTSLGYALLCCGFFNIQNRPRIALLYFIASLLYLTLLRSSFTYVHGLVLMALFFSQIRKFVDQRTFGICFAIALVSIFILPAKNYVLYGFFGSSSWAPQNIASGVGVKFQLAAFPSPVQIRDEYPEISCEYTHDWIDIVDTVNGDRINYNSCLVVQYSKIIMPKILKEYNFLVHLQLIKENILAYFRPSYMYFVINDYNANKLKVLRSVYENLTMTIKTGSQNIRLLFLILPIWVVGYALRRRDTFAMSMGALFLLHFLTSVTTDGRESDRFVFDIEFLFYIFLGIALASVLRSLPQRPGPLGQSERLI